MIERIYPMVDVLLQYIICSLMSLSILRLVFSSAIFSYYREFIYGKKQYYAENGKYFRYYFLYALGCWQCFGYWSALFTTIVVSAFIPGVPVILSNVFGLFVVFLAVGVTTDIAGEYIPATVSDFSEELSIVNIQNERRPEDGSELASELDAEDSSNIRADVPEDDTQSAVGNDGEQANV